jgi:hypothetical protein
MATSPSYGITLPILSDKPRTAQTISTRRNSDKAASRPSVSEKIDFVLDEIDKKERELKGEMERVTMKKDKTEKKQLWISNYLRNTPDIFTNVNKKYMIHVCSCHDDDNLQKERLEGLHYVIDKLEEEIKRQQSKGKDVKKETREERNKTTQLMKQLQLKNEALIKELVQEQQKNVELRRKVRELKRKGTLD